MIYILDWDSIAGLDYAKTIIKEAVIWPMIRPELFRGLRKPPKGILLVNSNYRSTKQIFLI